MSPLARIVNTCLLLMAPFAAIAHPGHADGAPLVHELSHNLHCLAAWIAIVVLTVRQVDRLLRAARRPKVSNALKFVAQ